MPAMMDCWSYGKLSVKHNIDPRPLCPTPANSGFTLVAAVPPGGAFCNVGLPIHCHTNFSQPPVSILFSLSCVFAQNLGSFSRTTHLFYLFFFLYHFLVYLTICLNLTHLNEHTASDFMYSDISDIYIYIYSYVTLLNYSFVTYICMHVIYTLLDYHNTI